MIILKTSFERSYIRTSDLKFELSIPNTNYSLSENYKADMVVTFWGGHSTDIKINLSSYVFVIQYFFFFSLSNVAR